MTSDTSSQPRDSSQLSLANSAAQLAELPSSGVDPRASNEFGGSLLVDIATGSSSVEERTRMLVVLAEAGVDLDEHHRDFTALAAVAMNGHDEAVEALLAAGASPNVHPDPLGAACWISLDVRHAGIERSIELLVLAGCEPDGEDRNGLRPLHAALAPYRFGADFASSDGLNVAAAFALVRANASVDISFPESGYTALHAACAGSAPDLVALFLEHQISPLDLALDGSTAFDVALRTVAALRASPPTRDGFSSTVNADVIDRQLAQVTRRHVDRIQRTEQCMDLLAGSQSS